MPKKRRKFHATTVRVTGTKTRTQTLTENPTAEMGTAHTAEDKAAPTANSVTANHSTGLRPRHSSTHMKLLQHTTVITKEMQQSHRWTATTGNTPITGSGTSTQAAAPLQQGAAPLSTFKTTYQGDAAFKELLQQKKIGQQHKSSTNQDCNHTSAY